MSLFESTAPLWKTDSYTVVFVKIGYFIKFKGFLVQFLENRRS